MCFVREYRLCRECQTLIEHHDQIKLLSNARNNLNTTLKVPLTLRIHELLRHCRRFNVQVYYVLRNPNLVACHVNTGCWGHDVYIYRSCRSKSFTFRWTRAVKNFWGKGLSESCSCRLQSITRLPRKNMYVSDVQFIKSKCLGGCWYSGLIFLLSRASGINSTWAEKTVCTSYSVDTKRRSWKVNVSELISLTCVCTLRTIFMNKFRFDMPFWN